MKNARKMQTKKQEELIAKDLLAGTGRCRVFEGGATIPTGGTS